MNLTIISSSQRPNSESKRVGAYMLKEITKKIAAAGGAASHIDLLDLGLPFFDDTLETNTAQQSLWNPISEKLAASDGFVFITPEWNGMASPMLKNFLMFVGKELANKPVLLTAVSSGMGGGAYPIAEIRGHTAKNSFACYIPNHVIIRNVNQCLVDETLKPENKSDSVARERIDFSLDTLIAYTKALKTMRSTEQTEWTRFDTGM
ncbi:MAG: NADPH-dependent reductase [Candidatus Taylorbacteria bacterium]|nr:NADPH-dependent reductase [Candidatus Taylorbacteria bacterium]